MHLKVSLVPIMGPVILKQISHRIGATSATSFAKTASAVRKKAREKRKKSKKKPAML